MNHQPLAYRMRPKNIDQIIGQEHLVGEGKVIRRMVSANKLASMILFGAPGTGKTSMAEALAKSLNLPYRELNAVVDKKKDIEIVVEEAKMAGSMVLILDEVHRLDKAKQDFLLPHLENNLLTMIGCTTSNPYHSINPAIRSRTHLFELEALKPEDISIVVQRALTDENEGYGHENINLSDNALRHFSESANGDLRAALNGLELAVSSTPPNENNEKNITLEVAEECMQKKSFSHDKGGDAHYDVLSAFQKSIRGSDVDAALHYMARLIEAGDLESIARRMTVIAYEDIGLGNPAAGMRTLAAIQADERVGFPEARIPLSVALIELCLSPKSNSAYKALDQAINDVKHGDIGEIPLHLKDSHYYGASKLGRGVDYKYPHNYPGGWVKQDYLPETLRNKKYYQPLETGKFERALKQMYQQINNHE